LRLAPELTLNVVTSRSVHWYAMSEDLANPESRTTMDGGRVRLDWKRSNWSAHEGLLKTFKERLPAARRRINAARFASGEPLRRWFDHQRTALYALIREGLRRLGERRRLRRMEVPRGAPVFHTQRGQPASRQRLSGLRWSSVSYPINAPPISFAFLRAAQELGIPFNAEFNGAIQDGTRRLYQVDYRGIEVLHRWLGDETLGAFKEAAERAQSKAKQSKAKQSKAKQSKAKQGSHARGANHVRRLRSQ
jgi:hypothetical protein